MDRPILHSRCVAGLSVAVIAAATTLFTATPSEAQQPAAGNAAVERGRYLVRITGCHDCHSPKVKGMTPDLDRALSGRPTTTALPTPSKEEVHASADLTAWQGPWGFSVASNLTPDPTTGIGTRYNEASFLATMRTGKKPNGTPIMPPMPSEVYQNMTDDDLKAIFAYLRTIKPIRNAVFTGLTPPGGTQKPAAGGEKK
ncbi:MAG TPA: c-type cytochrome [Vicinamibacterales bacterium]|jgi:mono/diheme cytochrome c family protein|nr:c-type cytochrome [Vicinamibacterales bacterium]